MNKLVVVFYTWKEQIKNFYASAGALIAIVSSVLLVGVGLPLQIVVNQGAADTAIIGGIAGGLITLLIENLTQKGCGVLWRINQATKEAKHKNAELKARTLLELQAQNMPLTIPAAIEEAMQSALKEAQAGRNVAYVFIALGVMASIAGNSLFWDAILRNLPMYDVIGVTAIFSFIIPTILIDSELRADLHRELLEGGMNSAENLERAAQLADTRVALNQSLADQDKTNIASTATREVLREVSSARMDKMLDKLLGEEGVTSRYRADASGANLVGAKMLQQQLAGPNAPLLLPAPDPNTLVLQQVTATLQQLSQQQQQPQDLTPLIEAGVQKALAAQQQPAASSAEEKAAEPGQEQTEEPALPEQPVTAEQLAALIEAGVQKALAAQQQTITSSAEEKVVEEQPQVEQGSQTIEASRMRRKPTGRTRYYECREDLKQMLAGDPTISDQTVADHFGIVKSTANSWRARLKKEAATVELAADQEVDDVQSVELASDQIESETESVELASGREADDVEPVDQNMLIVELVS